MPSKKLPIVSAIEDAASKLDVGYSHICGFLQIPNSQYYSWKYGICKPRPRTYRRCMKLLSKINTGHIAGNPPLVSRFIALFR